MKKKAIHTTSQTSSPMERVGVKLKVCGMKHNVEEVAELQPDYLGFIFWEPSKRYFEGLIPNIDSRIKKIGVFVNADSNDVIEKVHQFDLQGVQLHGAESPEYCDTLGRKLALINLKKNSTQIKLIKVFSIKDNFDFKTLEPYEKVCDYYLFDTKGKLPGGNGYTFNWKLLKNYPSTKPYFLSGGIGLEEVESIKAFIQRPEAKYCHAIDVNSRFEIKPGLKDIEKLKKFKIIDY